MRNPVLLAILSGFATYALGQRVSRELRLYVTDATGGGVPATGMILGRAAGVDRSFETDETGHTIVRSLPPGRYEVTLRSEGFTARTISIDIQSSYHSSNKCVWKSRL